MALVHTYYLISIVSRLPGHIPTMLSLASLYAVASSRTHFVLTLYMQPCCVVLTVFCFERSVSPFGSTLKVLKTSAVPFNWCTPGSLWCPNFATTSKNSLITWRSRFLVNSAQLIVLHCYLSFNHNSLPSRRWRSGSCCPTAAQQILSCHASQTIDILFYLLFLLVKLNSY